MQSCSLLHVLVKNEYASEITYTNEANLQTISFLLIGVQVSFLHIRNGAKTDLHITSR